MLGLKMLLLSKVGKKQKVNNYFETKLYIIKILLVCRARVEEAMKCGVPDRGRVWVDGGCCRRISTLHEILG